MKETTNKTNGWTIGLALLGIVSLASVAQAQTNATTTTNVAAKDFFTRFDNALREQLSAPAYVPPATNAPAPQRRGLPPPFDAPPYPTGEWQIGGTPIIGDPNALPTYPLMEALYGGPGGDALKKSKINFYGWEDFSGNLSTSQKFANANNGTGTGLTGVQPAGFVAGQSANAPEAYDSRPNQLEQNQFVFYLERDPDEFQTDHIDWGFRISAVYGLDYRYMISLGLWSNQLWKHTPGVLGNGGNPGNYYGFDTPMVYYDLYFPGIAQGMNLRLGRIISEADIEAQLAPNNLMSSHSLLYTFDPYCQTGIFTTTKLNDEWLVQLGLSCGNDVMPWKADPGNQPTAAVMLQWQSKNGKWGFYGGGNCINNAEFGFNNIQQYVGTITYKFNERIWTSHETWYMYQYNATTGPSHSVPYQNGAFPWRPGYAPEWATLNYTMFRLGPSTFFTVRNEIFDDIVGNRTGIATAYDEHSIGLTWWPDNLITIRPELRYDHSIQKAAYDNPSLVADPNHPGQISAATGGRHSQFTASCDVVFHF